MRLTPLVTPDGKQLWFNPDVVRTVGPSSEPRLTRVYTLGSSSYTKVQGAPEEVALKLATPLELDTMAALLTQAGWTVTPPGGDPPAIVPFPQPEVPPDA